METAEGNAADRFWVLLIGLKAEFGLDTWQIAAAVALHTDAASEGLKSREFVDRLTPVLGTSPESAKAIRQRLIEGLEAGESPGPGPGGMREPPEVSRRSAVWFIGCAAAIVALLVLAAVYSLSRPEADEAEMPNVVSVPEAPSEEGLAANDDSELSYGAEALIVPDPRAGTIQLWQVVLAALPLMAAPLWLWALRRYRLGQPPAPGQRTSAGRELAAAKDPFDQLFETSAFRKSSQNLRRHVRLPSRRLDAQRTIGRTIRNAGLFTPVTVSRLAMPEHIVLIERNAVHDHLADLYHFAVSRLREEGLQVLAYDFWGDPRTIVACPSRTGDMPQTALLEALPGRRDAQRIVVLGSASIFFEPFSDRLSKWVQMFDLWETRAVLDPHQPAQPEWSVTEMQLPEAGWMIGPARQDALVKFASRVAAEGDGDRLLAGRAAPKPDA